MSDKVIIMPIMCDCCGKEKLAEVKGDKLIIYDTRHGQRHFAVVNINLLMAIASTTTSVTTPT